MAIAALDLFDQRGYDAVSTAQIAARAGVTERTFFRHFASKREVLFDGEAVLRDALLAAIADVPDGIPPLLTLFRSFHAITPLLEANRPFAAPRQGIIARTPALAERELAKIAALTDVLAAALRKRGAGDADAAIAAYAGMGLFTHVTVAWLAKPEPGLDERLTEAATALTGLIAETARTHPGRDIGPVVQS